MIDDGKPDVTSRDYLAGLERGRGEGRATALRQAKDKLARLAVEVKKGRHQKSGLNLLREAWRRMETIR